MDQLEGSAFTMVVKKIGYRIGGMEEVMLRNLAFVIGYAPALVLFTAASVPAAQFSTEEAKAMVERVIAG